MRVLTQPGPVHPRRIESLTGEARTLSFAVPAGATLLDGLTAPLAAAGFQSAVLRFSGARLNPFRYVMPDRAADDTHVAYFSAPRAPEGTTVVDSAAATFGWNDGAPFLHCHAFWTEPDGKRRGGHILNADSRLTSPLTINAWAFDSLRIATAPDAETNFTLFQPTGDPRPGANAILARVRPNEDILTALETIAADHAWPNATVVGSVGSLVGTRFADGRDLPDRATEVLVLDGAVRNGRATLDLASIDMKGEVHTGRIAHGENAVCITFDLVLLRGDP